MATRHNLSPNPACAVDATGWTSNGVAPTKFDVTGLGFARQFAARFDDGSVAFSPQGAASAGLAYTVSVHVRPVSFTISGSIFIEFLNSGGSSLAFSSSGFTAPTSGVTRISQSDTAPANTAFVRFVITGENYGSNVAYYTQHLIEQTGSLDTYFDGEPPGSWDGTTGASTSTLSDSQTITLTRATETDTARALTAAKSATLGRAGETDTARAISFSKLVALSRATESDTARSLTVSKSLALGRAVDASTARPLTLSKTLAPGRAAEADTARALAVSRQVMLGRAAETDLARPLLVTKTVVLGRAVEADTARPLNVSGGVPQGSLHNLGGSLATSGRLGGSVVSSALGGSLT